MKKELRDEFALSLVNQMAKRNSITVDTLLSKILVFFGIKKIDRTNYWNYNVISEECYKFADIMIKEREKSKAK